MIALLSKSRCSLARNHIKNFKFNSPSLRQNLIDMAHNKLKAPYTPQDAQEVISLVEGLEKGSRKKSDKRKTSFSCKKSSFNVNGVSKTFVINSWRFHDRDYKCPNLPTYARGLFLGKNEKDEDEIMIRGYDKFFNTGEVSATKWVNIIKNTKGPYELSLKENGCIIFISGLCDGTLLVCSKHSTGPRQDEVSHAIAGEKWIDKQLASIGKTRENLARELRSMNATAVAELCDDEFEEHILAYNKENSGLYLHGINLNIPKFSTYPSKLVQDFAEKWGFKKTYFLTHDDIFTTKNFLEDIAKTGSYNGRDVEGFVIRCKARQDESDQYDDWFFKYKFEEPYLMYRQWREFTKAIIAKKTYRIKKHVSITEKYLCFAQKKINEDPSLGKKYANNHGIIKLRDDFLREMNSTGTNLIKQEQQISNGATKDFMGKIVLIPVATIGCGKTTIAVSLNNIYGWGHVQNDDISGKNRPLRFTKEVLAQLQEKSVVFADRNNFLRREREQLIGQINSSNPDFKLVALNFVHETESIERIRKVTQQRVISRGDNHQTIQAATDQNKAVTIMEGFIKGFEHLDGSKWPDDTFDVVIDLDPTLDSRINLETVIKNLHYNFPSIVTDIPSKEALDKAISYAMNEYLRDKKRITRNQGGQITVNPAQKSGQNKVAKNKSINYFAIKFESTKILKFINSTFESISPDKRLFWKKLNEAGRVQPEFHTTLIHRSSKETHEQLWKKYTGMYQKECSSGQNVQKIGDCKVLLERIVWDMRLMAIVVRIIDEGWDCANPIAHITIGTRDNSVKPKESNDLLKRWIDGCDEINAVTFEGHNVIDGVVATVH